MFNKFLKLWVIKIIKSGYVNLLLLWIGEYLYNSVIHDLSKKSLKFEDIIPKSIERKMNFIDKILKYCDPIITVSEDKIKLRMRLSFKNVYFYARFPLYDRALPRICHAIKNIENELFLIDIGANIGDTAVLVSKNIHGGSILCIEGNEQVIPFLKYNTAKIKNNKIFIDSRFCVDSHENNQFSVKMDYGTAHLSKSNTNKINAATLDDMIADNSLFKNTNILKIDTDGFEITVLNGAKKLLKEKHPVLYFEFTPDAYIENGQDPLTLINILVSYSYTKALFYTNFGIPVDIYDLTNKAMIQEAIKKIDNKNIYYYDILAIPDEKIDKYKIILDNELEWKNN